MQYRDTIRTMAAVAFLTLSTTTTAAIIDFTDTGPGGAWEGANGQTVFSVGGVTVLANLGTLTTNTFESSGCALASPLVCGGDGLGINDDEITGNISSQEALTVEFATPTHVRGIHLLDLFDEGDTGETAIVHATLADMSTVDLVVSRNGSNDPVAQPGGYLFFETGIADKIRSLRFRAANDGVSDYAVAAVVTPLPAAVWLFGSALLGIAGFGRLRQRRVA